MKLINHDQLHHFMHRKHGNKVTFVPISLLDAKAYLGSNKGEIVAQSYITGRMLARLLSHLLGVNVPVCALNVSPTFRTRDEVIIVSWNADRSVDFFLAQSQTFNL